MQNKIWIGLVVVLIIAVAGLYLAITSSRELKASLNSFATKIDQEIQRLNPRTAPAVYVGEPMGYVIQFENGVKFYFAGDTNVIADMKYVIGDYYKPDVAFLPIGGYFTMGPKEAAYATSLIRPQKYVIPMHYKSFPILVQGPEGFFFELKKYDLVAQPLKFEIGEEKEVLGVKVLWLSHGSWLFESPEGVRILIDPSIKLSATWPDAYRDLAVFEKIDLILLTHGHPDHVVTSDLTKLAKLYDPLIFASYDLGNWLSEYVAPAKIFSYLNKGGNISKEEVAKVGYPAEKMGDIRIYAVTADHSSSAMPQ